MACYPPEWLLYPQASLYSVQKADGLITVLKSDIWSITLHIAVGNTAINLVLCS